MTYSILDLSKRGLLATAASAKSQSEGVSHGCLKGSCVCTSAARVQRGGEAPAASSSILGRSERPRPGPQRSA